MIRMIIRIFCITAIIIFNTIYIFSQNIIFNRNNFGKSILIENLNENFKLNYKVNKDGLDEAYFNNNKIEQRLNAATLRLENDFIIKKNKVRMICFSNGNCDDYTYLYNNSVDNLKLVNNKLSKLDSLEYYSIFDFAVKINKKFDAEEKKFLLEENDTLFFDNENKIIKMTTKPELVDNEFNYFSLERINGNCNIIKLHIYNIYSKILDLDSIVNVNSKDVHMLKYINEESINTYFEYLVEFPKHKYTDTERKQVMTVFDTISFDKMSRVSYARMISMSNNYLINKEITFNEKNVFIKINSSSVKTTKYQFDKNGNLISYINFSLENDSLISFISNYTYNGNKLESIKTNNFYRSKHSESKAENNCQSLIFYRKYTYEQNGSYNIFDIYSGYGTEIPRNKIHWDHNCEEIPIDKYITSLSFNAKSQLIEKRLEENVNKIYYLKSGNIDKIEEYTIQKDSSKFLLCTHKFIYKDTLLQRIENSSPMAELYEVNGNLANLNMFVEYEITYDSLNRLTHFNRFERKQKQVKFGSDNRTQTANTLQKFEYSFSYDEHGFIKEYTTPKDGRKVITIEYLKD